MGAGFAAGERHVFAFEINICTGTKPFLASKTPLPETSAPGADEADPLETLTCGPNTKEPPKEVG
jgi:hypothetical protein